MARPSVQLCCVYSTLCILSMGPVPRPQSEFNTFVPHNQKKKYEISNNKYYLLSPGLMKYMLSISYYDT